MLLVRESIGMYKIFFSGGIAIAFNSFSGDWRNSKMNAYLNLMFSCGIIGGIATNIMKFKNSIRTISAVVVINPIMANINAI